ncbi:MobQ family relaxase [Escherichia coli]|uniref:MobQ family relaxase n=1 Tax=Escherichia coli TaxID=562 RepID=UPI0035C216F3
MAIFHFSVKAISRSAGRSAVACSAYRSGEKLEDHYQGKTQDYTQKTGVESKKIYAPENTKKELLDRQELWNTVEQVERRKDATLAREFEIAFPHEFNAEQRQDLLDELCQGIVEKHGVIVDACIHAPHTKSGSDERNFHAHIMFTSRQIDPQTGDFAKKKNRDFNKEQSSETVSHWREHFAELTNRHLEKHGFADRVDHRSYKDQGIDLEATQHEGPHVTQLRRQGIDTEISLSNDAIRERNQFSQHIKGLDQEIQASERLLNNLIQTRENLDQEQRSPEKLTKIAYSVISQYNDAIATEAKNIALTTQKTEIEQIGAVLEQIELSRNSLEHQKEQLGKRPMLFGGKWDTANAEIRKQLNQLEEQERELRNNSPRFEPERYTDRAKQTVNKANPNLKAKYDRARNYLEREQQRKLAEQEKRKQEAKAQQEQEKQAFFARKALREQGKHDEANKMLEAEKRNRPRSR